MYASPIQSNPILGLTDHMTRTINEKVAPTILSSTVGSGQVGWK